MTILPYIRAHPFSTMALCNIVGDLGYLGYAFDAEGFVSLPKLGGAGFTVAAHLILLAYGDDQARKIAHEHGILSRITLTLRAYAQRLTKTLPYEWQDKVRARPIGISFGMLAFNGAGLFADALLRLRDHGGAAMSAQLILGFLIILGTGLFAAADFVRRQKTADILTKIAPSVLTCASVANVGLAATTGNAFVILSVIAFAFSNLAGFFTKIDKKLPVSAGL